jgi:hypothetical protein
MDFGFWTGAVRITPFQNPKSTFRNRNTIFKRTQLLFE